jgi:hypothetical protein
MPSERKIYVTVRWIWIAACLSILLLGLGAYRIEPSDRATALELLPFMLIFSFPSGLMVAVMVGPFITSDPPTQFLVFWLSMFCAGYYQWFVLLPSLGKSEIISLGLIESNTRRADPVVLTRPKTRRRRQRTRSIPAFDKNGLSPLQRAIDKTDREMRSVSAGKGLRS